MTLTITRLDLSAADLRDATARTREATRDPADLGGMPWVTDGRTVRCRPDWLPTEGRGILFLDELPQAGLANLNIAATLIREHRIGEHRLPPTWMVACAGNHHHNRAGTTTMPSHVRR
jgi:MoxR-like ATPase